jgi:hypothetical protein
MSEPFDFEAFIAGTQLPRDKVSFFKVDHSKEIDRLTAEHDALPPEGGDERESSRNGRAKIAQRILAQRDAMAASETFIEIRTLGPDEFKAIRDDESVTIYDQFATQTVDPVLTADQVRRLAAQVGAAQWGRMAGKANDLILSKVAVPDFSPSTSETLSPRDSSRS